MAFLNLIAKLGLDGSGFRAGLKDARSAAGNFSNDIKRSLAGAFTVGAITAATKKVVEYGGKIKDISDRLGVSTDQLQKWDYALSQSGSGIEDLSTSLTALSKARQEALDSPGSEQEQAFRLLGVSPEALRGGTLQSIFNTIAKTVQTTNFGAGEEALISKVLGKSSPKFIAALKSDMAGLGDEAERLGAILDKGVIENLDNIGDRFTQLTAQLRGPVASAIGAIVSGIENLKTISAGLGAASVGSKAEKKKGILSMMFPVADLFTDAAGMAKRFNSSTAIDAMANSIVNGGATTPTATRTATGNFSLASNAKDLLRLQQRLTELTLKNELDGLSTAEKKLRLEKELLAVRGQIAALSGLSGVVGGLDQQLLLARIGEQELLGQLGSIKGGGRGGLELNSLQRIGAFTTGAAGDNIPAKQLTELQKINRNLQERRAEEAY